jgi:c-di-GMP-related signal transduction protein
MAKGVLKKYRARLELEQNQATVREAIQKGANTFGQVVKAVEGLEKAEITAAIEVLVRDKRIRKDGMRYYA